MTLPTVIYIAGPMRGIPQFNFPSFDNARERLRSAGWEVICPAERDRANGFDPVGLNGREDPHQFGADLQSVLEQSFRDVLAAEAVALLPGWARSEGARAEALVAHLSGRPLFQYFQHRPTPLEPLIDVQVRTMVETIR